MRFYGGCNPGEVYRAQLQDILDGGEEVTVGGKRTKELLNVVTEITEPRQRLQVVPGRRLNPWLALSEALWLLSGRQDMAALEPYNRRIADFSDDGETLYGAYGYRLLDQIPPLLERLVADPNDRRAVLTIWRPEDLTADTKSPPCNDLVMFKLREDELYMTVICRSNDLHWGLHAVNLIQFSILQEYIAARLGARPATQIHWSDSLHIYLDGPAAKITEHMIQAADDPFEPMENQWLFSNGLPSHEEFVGQCSSVLDGRCNDYLPFFRFAADFLAYYRDVDQRIEQLYFLDRCRFASVYPEWVAAGKEFLQCKE